jgi:hypothetical protein
VSLIDRFADHARKRFEGVDGVDHPSRVAPILIYFGMWGLAFLILGVIIYFVGGVFGLWHMDPFGPHCDPTYGCPD